MSTENCKITIEFILDNPIRTNKSRKYLHFQSNKFLRQAIHRNSLQTLIPRSKRQLLDCLYSTELKYL